MSAKIPNSMLLKDLLKPTGFDCPESLQDKTFNQAINGESEAVSPVVFQKQLWAWKENSGKLVYTEVNAFNDGSITVNSETYTRFAQGDIG